MHVNVFLHWHECIFQFHFSKTFQSTFMQWKTLKPHQGTGSKECMSWNKKNWRRTRGKTWESYEGFRIRKHLVAQGKWTQRVSKELVLPKLVDRTVIEIQQYFSCCCFCFVLLCVELDNLIFKFPWKSKGPRITEKQFWKSTRWKNLSYQISTFIVKIFSKEDSVGRAPETLMEQTREPPRACPSWETTQGRGDITVSMQKEWSVW